MALRNKKWVVADFETTGEDYYNKYGYTKVWLYAISDSDGNIINNGSSIDEFMDYCKKNLCSYIVYFHNLKFDGNFIIYWLLDNGYAYNEKLKVTDKRKQFTTLIGDMGEFYNIKVNFMGNKQVVFQDSLKILPMKVKAIAEGFGFEEKKLKIDYKDYKIDDKKIEYVNHDVIIVAKALKEIKEHGINRMTVASSAYKYYMSLLNGKDKDLFPELTDEFLSLYRLAYRGGRSQVNPLYKNKIVHNIKRYDINSMYPYIMHDMPLPYGVPIWCKEPGHYKFELYKVYIQFSLRQNHLPSLLKKGSIFREDSYYIETEGVEELCISNIDLELVKRNYDIIYLEFIEIWGFHTSTNLFKEYVDYFYNLKQSSKGGKRLAYKFMLNALYGKFGSNFMSAHKIPSMEDGHVKYTDSEPQPMKKYYLPMAIAITSWAHMLIDDAIHKTGYDKFVYCDTDSVHTLGNLPDDWVDNRKLGKFKLENVESKGRYVRQKCYVYEDSEGINITCAGMNDELKELAINQYKGNIFSIFQQGFEVHGKLLPKVVKGGVVLYETHFKIK